MRVNTRTNTISLRPRGQWISAKYWLFACTALALTAPVGGRAQTAPAATPAPAATTVAAGAAATATNPPVEEIIVTGTRQTTRTKLDSAAPIDVISGAELARTGQTNVFDALDKIVPSLDLPEFGFDTAGLVRAARLRGLSPDDVLVLIDGKRRHVSANINADIGPVGGSDPVDFDMIPISLIDRVEVLRDGAAAVYGSDAVAGVINIILKKADHGGNAYVQEGATYAGDGFSNSLGTSLGFGLGPNGYFDVSGDYAYHDHTNRDGNFIPQTGQNVGGPLGPISVANQPSRIEGDPRYNRVNLGYNAGYEVNDEVELYSFGTYGYRHAESFENFRDPNYAGAFGTGSGPYGNLTAAVYYPHGFTPLEALNEDDYSVAAGVRSTSASDWRWDLSTVYGGDIDNVSTLDSLNPSFLQQYGYSPLKFHAGEFNNSEWTNNLDISKPVEVGIFATPLNVAFGGEFRRNTYQIQAGDAPSYYGGGAQAYPGFTPQSAGYYERTNEAGYLDLDTDVLPGWEIRGAGRFEHYSDFGNSEAGQFTTRYEITPQLAIRGTISNGFRAPSLAQEGFAAVNVAPTNATAQFPVDSAAAKLLGASPLKPERSQNYTGGITYTPIEHMHFALDFYQIDIRDQIVDSGLFGGPLVLEAIALNGSQVPPGLTASDVLAQFYTNGVNTRTQGADLTWDYTTFLPNDGRINWLVASNVNSIVITRTEASAGLTPDVLSEIKDATPKSKTILQATYLKDPWTITLRETRYGQVAEIIADGYTGGTPFTYNRAGPSFITDLDINYKITPHLTLTLGANNLFDKYAPHSNADIRYQNAEQYIITSPYGIDGGIYYLRAGYKF